MSVDCVSLAFRLFMINSCSKTSTIESFLLLFFAQFSSIFLHAFNIFNAEYHFLVDHIMLAAIIHFFALAVFLSPIKLICYTEDLVFSHQLCFRNSKKSQIYHCSFLHSCNFHKNLFFFTFFQKKSRTNGKSCYIWDSGMNLIKLNVWIMPGKHTWRIWQSKRDESVEKIFSR